MSNNRPALTGQDIINGYSTPALAFLGDAVYEQLVRKMLVLKSNKPAGILHEEAVRFVCCEFQSKAVTKIYDRLSAEEQEIFRRGRNHDGISPPKHSKAQDYRRATGLECIFGYLSLLGDENRIAELFETLVASGE